ncbi:MAG TPA: DUF5691 domain-containing protein [Chloroflexota bacterium]|nr:DUF5691 domain-containing protein [Chloroflexota bacterium]
MSTPVALALAGTVHHQGVAPTTGTALDHTLADLQAESPERALLLAAGVSAVARMAGRRSGAAAPLPTPCPLDPMPALNAGGAALIAALLAGQCPPEIGGLIPDTVVPAGVLLPLGADRERILALLPEAFALLARAGRRLPPALLATALDQKDDPTRAALLPVLGERGRWLAAQNPAWHWVRDFQAAATPRPVPANAETIWQEGTTRDRVVILEAVRAADAEQGRQWLAQTWKSEKADVRLALLDGMAANLSLADEPFLEAVLDEKAERIRARAAELLAALPGSGLAARMKGRALATLATLPHGPGARPVLVTTPPEELSPDWQRDGILAKPPNARGPRAGWYEQVLALAPPATWVEWMDASPEDIVSAAQTTEWETALFGGWARAAIRFNDPDWLQPLWQAWPQDGQTRSDILRAMPAAMAENTILAFLTDYVAYPGRDDAAPVWLLPQPWSEQFSQAMLLLLRQIGASSPHRLIPLLGIAGPALHPALLTQALDPWQAPVLEDSPPDFEDYRAITLQQGIRQALGQFLTVIAVRRLLHEMITP